MLPTTTAIIISLNNKKHTKTSQKELLLSKKTPQKATQTKETENYIVDIKGEVNMPGIYKLKKNSRVVDVIEKAGGLTENANTTVINLSKKINDEMVIIIYSNYEIENFKSTKEQEENLISKCEQKDSNSLKNDACMSSSNTEQALDNTKISLNNATKEELMTLSGIGESKADDIIKYREENGEFKNIEDIKNIKGIGDAIFDKIKDRLTL